MSIQNLANPADRPLIEYIRTPVSIDDDDTGNDELSISSCAKPNPIIVSDLRPTDLSKLPKFERYDQLNWCDRDEVNANMGLFDLPIPTLLQRAETKRTRFPDGFEKGNYFQNLIPIIASGYQRSEKILCCGNTNLSKKKIPCDQWHLCSKCSYMRRLKASEMFRDTYSKAYFYHITLGFDGDMAFNETNSVVAQDYWDANQNGIRQLFTDQLIAGAYMVHELKIRSFVPLRVNPHSHAIVTATSIPSEVEDSLRNTIKAHSGVELKPSIMVKLLHSSNYQANSIRYLTKEMDLQEPYLSAWWKHCKNDRTAAPELNREMRVLLDAQAVAFGGSDKIVYMGNLKSQRKEFIGVKKADRTPKKRRRSKMLRHR